MPGVPVIPGQELAARLANYEMRLRAIEQQQQITWINGALQPLLNMGMSPGSNPPQYGLQMVNPSTGTEEAFLGEDADNVTALKFRDTAGNVIVQVDVEGIHIYND